MDEVTRARFLALEARCEAAEARLRALEVAAIKRAAAGAPAEHPVRRPRPKAGRR